MNEINTNVPAVPTPDTTEEHYKRLITYQTQAEASLTQVQGSIDTLTNQLSEARRVQLMLVGQKQLLADLIKNSAPKETK